MNGKITILIADDNQEFSNTLASYLEKEDDMKVVGITRDGEDAIRKIKEMKPDVVLLDVIMPHLDGLGVLEKINSNRLEINPICIMLSAVGQDKITQKAITLGAEYYVVKPFDIQLLISRIREIKNFKPAEQNNTFVVKEAKQQYIKVAEENASNLEALVTNIIH